MSYHELASKIKDWGKALGFQQVGITDTDLTKYQAKLQDWLSLNYHGKMTYMHKHGSKRFIPASLVPNTIRIISVRMDYLPPEKKLTSTLRNPNKGYISRYALGRDYHKVMRKRLEKLAQKIREQVTGVQYRVFSDSAPVMEKAIAEKAGMGWIGKHTNLINAKAGSWFFLGEIYTNIPLPLDEPVTKSHCGSCQACLEICPTQAIIAPYQLDARKCISYLTIELREAIPTALRPLIGNRIYGCDDCQLVCPWNKFAKFTQEDDFHPRNHLTSPDLIALFAWTEAEFLKKTEGSAMRRIGHEQWLRNIAVALGNAPSSAAVVAALKNKLDHPSALVREHVRWALSQHITP